MASQNRICCCSLCFVSRCQIQVAMLTIRPDHFANYDMLLRQFHEGLINYDCFQIQMHLLLWRPKISMKEQPLIHFPIILYVLMTMFVYFAMTAGTFTRLFGPNKIQKQNH